MAWQNTKYVTSKSGEHIVNIKTYCANCIHNYLCKHAFKYDELVRELRDISDVEGLTDFLVVDVSCKKYREDQPMLRGVKND